MAETILHRPAPGKRGRESQEDQGRIDDIKEWTRLGGIKVQSKAHRKEEWRKLVNAVASLVQ